MQPAPVSFRHGALSAVAWVALAALARADVLVVDKTGGPGSDFTAIQPAVTAAQEGDTILVRDGHYAWAIIDAKSLSIVAAGDAALLDGTDIFSTGPSLTVRNLGPHQAVLVRGIRVTSGVSVASCAGSVWFDALDVVGDVPCTPGGTHGATLSGSSRVTFTRSSLRGVTSSDPWYQHPTADGLRIVSGAVQLFDSEVRGGQGDRGVEGGTGLRVEGTSVVTVVGCTIVGGAGGLGSHLGGPCVATHPPGGPGIRFVDATATVRSAASTAVGGVRSLEPFCPGQSTPQGPPISGSGTIVPLPGLARHVRAGAPVRGGEVLAFELEAAPGEIPLLLLSHAHEPIGLLNGVLLLGLPPTDVFVLPPLPASGQASLGFPVPSLGAVESLHLYAQAAFLDASAGVWLGAGTTVVLLGAGF